MKFIMMKEKLFDKDKINKNKNNERKKINKFQRMTILELYIHFLEVIYRGY